jgi:serine protease
LNEDLFFHKTYLSCFKLTILKMLQFSKKISTFVFITMVSCALAQNSKPSSSNFVLPEKITSADYMQKTVIIKVKPEYRASCSVNNIDNPRFTQLYTSVGGNGLKKKFPSVKAPEKPVNEQGQAYADLSLIYEFKYTKDIDLVKFINVLRNTGLLEYAEPHYIPHISYNPNDPRLSQQYGLTKIQAQNAWGINTTTARGDTNVVIGITDTGTEPTHEDLKGNLKHNYADPIGGGDDDGDGFVDNFSGWDVGENDNDPTWQGDAHGVHVCGIAAATTDNSKGIAGAGFTCKYLPIKIADNSGTLVAAYEGIQYAADHGCSIINCSWGGGAGGQFAQDIITYATINKNALVVAAAGNDGVTTDFFPASLQYVISVANTNSTDVVATSSNYGYNIDVCAPGVGINATWSGNTYMNNTGTSMSSPLAAGAAGIIKSFYPSYNALQIGEQLKVTCDNIYSLNTAAYNNKLGKGRVNLYKALTVNTSPSIVTTSRTDTDGNDDTYVGNDTIKIRGNYINYLAPASNVTVTLTAIGSSSTNITIVDGTTTLGAMATLGVANNDADPFKVRIKPTAPLNTLIQFKLTFSDLPSSYTAVEYFTMLVNVDYVNININDVATSISSSGRIGYRADGQSGGLGFNYMNGGTLLYEAGLMIGKSSTQVSNVVRGETAGASDMDFQSVVTAHRVVPDVFSEFDVEGTIRDVPAATGQLPVTVHHKAFAWSTPGNRKYVIVEYVIKNTGTSALNNIYAGIFADWDIDAATFESNRASFDAANKMGYAFHTATAGKYAGIKLLTNSAPVVHYAIDNVTGGAGGVDLNTGGYQISEKYTTLSTNRTDAGVGGVGVDVCDVVSSGPFTISAGDSVKVAFALIAGDSLPDLQTSAVNAQIMYDGMTTTSITENITDEGLNLNVYPNPTGTRSIVELTIKDAADVNLKLYDMLGRQISEICSEKLSSGEHTFNTDVSGLDNGIYYYDLRINNKKYSYKLMIAK